MTEDEVAECFTTLLGLSEVKEERESAEHDIYKSDSMYKKKSLTKPKNLHNCCKNIITFQYVCVCVCPGGDSEYSLESAIPDEISMETFTGHILGFPSSAQQGGRSSSPE